MARATKAQNEAVGILIIIGGIIWLATKFAEAIGGTQNVLVLCGALVAVFVIYKVISRANASKKAAARRGNLMAKYKDNEIVDSIISQSIWQGETAEQLWDSLGKPEDLDEKVLKTKKKEIWKYGHEGGNRYRFRITVENDIVVGWENR